MLEHDILEKDVPVRYQIGVGEPGRSLLLSVHPQAVDDFLYMLIKPELPPVISQIQRELTLPDFIRPLADTWGFGSVLQSRLREDGWNSWECDLPKLRNPGKFGVNWEIAYATSATLNMFFRFLGSLKLEIYSALPQLMDINLITQTGDHGGSISITLGKAILPYLASKSDGSSPQIEESMRSAYDYMFGRESFGHFRAYFRESRYIHLDCPGDACGLDPSHMASPSKDKGYKLLPHNVDSPLQQLTLLMGVAALHDEARKAGL